MISSGDLSSAFNEEAKSVPAEVQSIYGPIANSLAALFQNRSNVLQGAINSYTPIYGALTGQYAPESQANYGEAMQSQAAIDSMLQSALGGQGAQAAAQLAKEIGSTGVAAPVANALEGTQAARYQGEQGAAAARGAASLSQLLGQGVNAADYGAKLPGIAGAAGLLATRQGQAQITNDELAAANSLAQSEGQSSTQMLSDLRQILNNSAMLELYYGPRGAAALQNAGTNQAKLPIDQQNANAHTTAANASARNAGTNAAKLPILQQNANSRATTAGAYAGGYLTAAQQKAAAAAAAAAAAQTRAGAATTTAGAAVTRANAYARGMDAKLASGGFTPAQIVKYKAGAMSAAQLMLQGGHDSKGNAIPALTYQQALAESKQAPYPTAIMVGALNQVYKPGVSGRPIFNAQQQAANAVGIPAPFGLLGLTGHTNMGGSIGKTVPVGTAKKPVTPIIYGK